MDPICTKVAVAQDWWLVPQSWLSQWNHRKFHSSACRQWCSEFTAHHKRPLSWRRAFSSRASVTHSVSRIWTPWTQQQSSSAHWDVLLGIPIKHGNSMGVPSKKKLHLEGIILWHGLMDPKNPLAKRSTPKDLRQSAGCSVAQQPQCFHGQAGQVHFLVLRNKETFQGWTILQSSARPYLRLSWCLQMGHQQWYPKSTGP